MSYALLAIVATLLSLASAVTDLRSGRIPNKLTLSAMFVGVALQGTSRGIAGLVESVVGIFVCAAVPGIVYKASKGLGIGGGDIKLFAALGALLGPLHGLEVELSAFLLLGIYALFRLAFLGQLGRTLLSSLKVSAGLLLPHIKRQEATQGLVLTEMRMGPAIALAVVTVLGLPYIVRWLPWLG